MVITCFNCLHFSVAPVTTSSYSKSFYESLHVPTMIVYGDKDLGLGLSSAKHLSDIPTATAPQILVNSRHPAYLDQPEIWHQLLYNFMLHLNC
jgi:pimeloyl-ACP methyl ester carboxylesterase